MKTLLALLLVLSLAGAARAAQVIIIPEGVTPSPALALNQLHRVSGVIFERTSNAFTYLIVTFQYCPAASSPCLTDQAWVWYGYSKFPGGGATTAVLGSIKELPVDVVATHIRIVTNAVGGTVTLQQAATITTKPGKPRK